MNIGTSSAPARGISRLPALLRRLAHGCKWRFDYLVGLGRRPLVALVATARRLYRELFQAIILRLHSRRSRRLILFLTPGHDAVYGGILSIASIYRESTRLSRIHHASVILCTAPGDPPLLRYTGFKNRNYILRLDQIARHFDRVEQLLIHIPECYVNAVLKSPEVRALARLPSLQRLHLNVLLQNIAQLEGQDIEGLRRLGTTTCTTGHDRYSTREVRNRLHIPLHKLSVYGSPELYRRTPYRNKRDLLIVSHDAHPRKAEILAKIAQALPNLEICIIEGLKYEKYKALIARAKWSLTFGEGFDGYFVEPVFSGAVAFAVRNQQFFPVDFPPLPTVYDSYQHCCDQIARDLARFDREDVFVPYQATQFASCARYYNSEHYRANIAKFYRGEYTFP